ncbi:C40 family peptidase [Ornithinimicrobium faecis]|uniref:C40 family peptidase n=1 Tax=Ornithinimicrobium faecis TaxID=2934158 RepID=UPI00211951F6|nr:C40 family peptidase [Ornithinimicrobium sp. HY1745]
MKRRTIGRHRAPLNLPRPLTGTATVAASGLLAATLGAATAVPAPPATAFGVTSTTPAPVPGDAQSMTAFHQSSTASMHSTATTPAADLPARAVPAPAPEDAEHTHFGELGFTGVTPEPEPVAAPSDSAAPSTESLADTSASAAQNRAQGTVSSRSDSRQEAPAESAAPVAPAGGQGAEAAIAWAQANLGLPYSWGSSSGGAYDCSGFTTAAFRAAGISIPHQSEAQYHATSRVSLSEIQRGDLLFYSNNGAPSGIFHVAIYLGNGQVIHSLRDWSSWDGSKVSGLHYASGLMAAGRP